MTMSISSTFVMKRFAASFLLIALCFCLVVSCSSEVSKSSREHDEALAFYRALNLIYGEIMDNMGEWNEWSRSASQLEFDRDIQNKCNRFESIFRDLHNNVKTLSAPDRLMKLKDTLTQATDKAAESFAMTRQYADAGGEAYYSEALLALNEYNRLMIIAAQEWDDGLTFYGIDLSEIFARD